MKWALCVLSGIAVVLVPFHATASELSWLQAPGFRSAELQPGTGGKPGFTLLEPKVTGVWFTNSLTGDGFATNAVAHNGSGVAVGDIDGDGRQDIFFCCLEGRNALYRNLGNWHFEEIDPGPAACADQLSTAANFADVDGDGHLDLLVNGIATGTRLFLNDGKGHFGEAKDSGLSRTASATSMTLADIDGDGDLDLYCTHYIDVMHLLDPTTRFSVMKRGNQWVVLKVNDQPTTLPHLKDRFEALPDGRVRELPEVHGLYRNEGHGRFKAIQFESGVFLNEEGQPIPPFRDWGLSAMLRDLNGDGAPDLYVCNDNVSPDRFWINTGKGTFRLIDTLSVRHTSRSSMGLDIADVDRDGRPDIFVLDMIARDPGKRLMQLAKDLPDPTERERVDSRPQFNRNTLFFSRPDGTYAEAALMAGVVATDWSWCPIFIDVDLDGYEDLLVSNGFNSDVMDQDRKDDLRGRHRRFSQAELKRAMEFYPRWHTAKAAFRNRRDGTFAPASQEWGFDQTTVFNGMAAGDLDNDGDLDLVANAFNGPAVVYRNNTTTGRVAVRLKGLPPNTRGIGAHVSLIGGSLTQGQEMISGGRYFSGDQATRVFALDPDPAKPMRLEVKWRNGDMSVITNIQANRVYEVDQTGAFPPGPSQGVPEVKPWFKDVSPLLGHSHVENDFDDWTLQPSLPRRLSRLGPGVCWFDADGDGWEDLVVASAKGSNLGVFQNEKGVSFRAIKGTPIADGDQGAVLGWSDAQGNRRLLVGVSNYEMASAGESQLEAYALANLAAPKRVPMAKTSIGPMTLADVDGDGDLDLFVGGRFAPGRYPEPVSCALWLNDGGEFKLSVSASQPFAALGLVSGATFADLDGDGWPDLVLAVEWGSVRVFRNNHGKLEDKTSAWGFGGGTGWWTSVAAGDFDGDGKLDLAVGNWGRNTMYELEAGAKTGVFFGDWLSDGKIALIEAWQQGPDWFPIHNRIWLAQSLPELASRFPTHTAFSKASVPQILGGYSQTAKKLEVVELRSGIFLNRGSSFEWRPLPRDAQLSQVFSTCVGDFNGDGIEDLFLSQNCFSAVPENTSQEAITRNDSGRGLLLRGTGGGGFAALDGSVTGIKIYGEQRGAAAADFNHDGRLDLCVAQNNGSTLLFANETGQRGLRVALRGPPGNPDAIGAQMRVRYADGALGPCRSVSSGTGYWSEPATVQVLGCARPPAALWVRWPGGREQTLPLEKDIWDVSVDFKDESH